MFKGILFDLDGTLIDTLLLIKQCYRKTFNEQMGVKVPVEQIMKKLGLPFKDICALFVPDRVEKAAELYYKFYEQFHDQYIRPYPGVSEVLYRLRSEGCQLGIVTSKRFSTTVKALEHFRLQDLFTVIVTADDCKRHKPHPDPVEKAVQLARLDPRAVLFVGDSPFDIQAGKSAGVKTAGITWGVSTKEELQASQPDFLVQNLNDIFSLMGKIRG